MKLTSSLLLQLLLFFSVEAQNFVTTYAGTGVNGYADGDTSTCKFKAPFGMCIDHSGNLYIADNSDHRIRKISADGIVTTIGGTGIAGYLDGLASTSKFNAPSDLCVDDSGNVYVSDFQNQYIRKISVNGTVSTIAGSGIAGYLDGASDVAEFNYPRGICRDAQGNLFIADSWNHRIRKIDTYGNVTTLAGYSDTIGVQSPGDYADGSDTSARFNVPCGMSIDSLGNLYLADAYNHRIRKVTPQGEVTTVAGSGSIGPNNGGFLDGDISIALLNTPTEVLIDHSGKVFIGDTYNNRIRLVEDGIVSTVAGNGNSGFVNGVDSIAKFKSPRGIAEDAGNHLFICDNGNHVIRKIWLSTSTDISAIEKDKPINIYPNPTQGLLIISSSNHLARISIVNILGEEVFSAMGFYNSLPVKLNLDTLSKGIYNIVLYRDSGQLETEKLMVAY